ncbi:hypothetical protein CPT_Moabite_301 [Serratia phage Moabite]|uniref:Uncharacterized protein n=1 Tax=Serratia phage Moabite TaxID=2587814 RepID=A0A4Y5TRU4_9CAUD|nr:hypothetical protein HWC48_gp115 [Serratia phage Moabite]QDB71331.1 hypothetical protein CPT_Moabite_301 [Serratia phage Moabite]UGO54184.1 hypothetical protein HAYMO_202 [Serratia phage vB_SmaM_Haymo]UQT03690.1 hypothetical protein KODAMA_02230 [Serratia phage vB_SmaM-Kodama]
MKTITVFSTPVPLKGFIHWCLLFVLYLLALAVAAVVTPFLPIFATKDARLPKWLDWFMMPDNDLDGDNGWKTEHTLWRKNLPPKTAQYICRVLWLYRNPLYNFSIRFLGAPKSSVKPTVKGPAWNNQTGIYKDHYWMIYYMGPSFIKGKRIKIYLGWKLKTENFDTYQLAVQFNPFKTDR